MQINVSVDRLNVHTEAVLDTAQRLRDDLERTMRLMEVLEGEWGNGVIQGYQPGISDLTQTCRQLPELLEMLAKEMTQITRSYEEAEQSLAERFLR